MMLDTNQLVYFVGALAPLYGWFVLVSPEKPIIYATHFTFPLLMFLFIYYQEKNLETDLINNSAFFVFCLYMTSNMLFLLAILFLIFINISSKIKYSSVLILISLSLLNSTYEVQQQEAYSINLNECKKNIASYECFEYLMNVKRK